MQKQELEPSVRRRKKQARETQTGGNKQADSDVLLANFYSANVRRAYQLSVAVTDDQALRQAELKAEADRLLQQGSEFFRISQYGTALEAWQTALELYREIGDRQGEANALGNLGIAYGRLGEYQRAIDFQQQSLAVIQEIGDRQDEANVLGNLGIAYGRLGEYQRAIDFQQQSLAIAREIGDYQGEANALGNLGTAYSTLGEYQQAINFQQQSLAIDREIGNRRGEAASLNSLGIVYDRLGEYQQAIDFQQQSLAIMREISDRQGEANALGSLGSTYSRLGEYQRAIDFQQQSLAIARQIGDRQSEANALGNLGTVYSSIGEYQQAINFQQQSLSINQEINSRQGEAASLGSLGIAYSSIGEYQQAINFQQQSLSINQEIGNLQGEANALNNLGLAYGSLGEYQRAIDFLQQSLVIVREIDDQQIEAKTLGNLGLAYGSLGEYQRAIDFLQQSLVINRAIGDRQSEADSLGGLATAYGSLGEYQRAIGFLQQTLVIVREISDQQGEAASLGILGSIYDSLGDYQKAIDFFQQSLAIAREIGSRQGEANALGNLGIAYYNLGEYQRAIDFLQQTLAIAREIGDRQGEAYSLNNLGIAYRILGEYQRAIDFHQQSLAIAREIGSRQGEADALGNLGIAYRILGEYQRAIDSLQQTLAIAREIGDRQGEADALGNLGIAYRILGEYQRAIDSLQQTLAIAREIGDRQGEAYSLNNLGTAWENQKHPEIAAIFYKSSINVYEAIRSDITELERSLQTSYINSVEHPYRSLIDLFLKQGRILEAQQVLELLKVEELREFTRATYSNGQLQYDPIEQPVAEAHGTLINLGAKIADCDPNCDQTLYDQQIILEGAFDETVKTFEANIRANRTTDDVFYNPASLASDALDIVNAQAGTVLIYPVVLEDTLWLLWTATGGVVGSVEVPEANQEEISRTVVRFRELLTQRDAQSLIELKQVGQQLYSWLIEPLSTELDQNNIQHLVFAQDRATRYLPMAALYDGEQFLLENYTISTVLSAALTDTTDRLGAVESANILGLGLDQAKEGFGVLPNVREELQSVIREGDADSAGIYPGDIFMNEDFTFATLSEQVRRHRILHIATHGEFVPNIKDASYLVDGNGQRLTIDQIGSLDTQFNNLHLVVLSACQTALGGESLDGTEIAGVSSYFLGKNKAEAVLATLWRVDDAGTSLLMQRFYEFMATGALTKAEALRQAQLSLLNGEATLENRFETLGIDRGGLVSDIGSSSSAATLDHPYYWAPFILIGNSL